MESLEQVLMAKGAMKIVSELTGVNKNDKVVITADMETVGVAAALAGASLLCGADATIVLMSPRPGHGAEPADPVAAAMAAATVVFQPAHMSITHALATKKAREKGARVVCMTEYVDSMLIRGSIDADFAKLDRDCVKLSSFLSEAKMVHVTSDAGTDLTFSIEGRPSRQLPAYCLDAGGLSAPPNVESNIAPIEGTAQGVLVADGSIAGIGVLKNNVTIDVRDGKAVGFRGGIEARELEAILRDANDPDVYWVAELGIGLNPLAKITGNMLEDEGCRGAIHIAFGTNSTFGGKIQASRHIDCILAKPTVVVDDETIIKDGVFLFC